MAPESVESQYRRVLGRFYTKADQFCQAYSGSFPAVFPAAMFELGNSSELKRQEKLEQLTGSCADERSSDPVLMRCFAPDAMDNEELREEFFSFAQLFYRLEPEEN